MITPIETANEIANDIKELKILYRDLESFAIRKANGLGNYRKAIQEESLKLKSDGMSISLIKDVARGNCYKQAIERDLSASLYQIQNTKIDIKKACMNGVQSINRGLIHCEKQGYQS